MGYAKHSVLPEPVPVVTIVGFGFWPLAGQPHPAQPLVSEWMECTGRIVERHFGIGRCRAERPA